MRRIRGTKRPADVPPIPAHVRVRIVNNSAPEFPGVEVVAIWPRRDPVEVEAAVENGPATWDLDYARDRAEAWAKRLGLPLIDETKGEHTRAMLGNV